jgi:RNA binding exosome subunit
MNKMYKFNTQKSSKDDLARSRDSLNGIDGNKILESLQKIVDSINSSILLYEKAKKGYYAEKIKWRNDVIKHETSLLEVMKMVKDPTNKKMIADSIVDFSQKILEIAEYDLTSKKTDNSFVKLLQNLIRRFDLDGKGRFWIVNFDKQKDILVELMKTDLDRDSEYKTCKMLINYCDLVVAGLDKQTYKSQLSKDFYEDFVSTFDDIGGSREVAEKIKETQAIRELAVNKIKKIKNLTDYKDININKQKECIAKKMLKQKNMKNQELIMN